MAGYSRPAYYPGNEIAWSKLTGEEQKKFLIDSGVDPSDPMFGDDNGASKYVPPPPPTPTDPITGGTPDQYNTLPVANPNIPGVQQDYETNPALYDFLKEPIASPDYQELLRTIGVPSSVDTVKSDIENQKMQELLKQIDEDTKNQAGSLKMDFLDRGLGGPGQISDIEAAGLGGVYGNAAKGKAAARLGYATSELDRLAGKEKSATDLYSELLKGNVGAQNSRDVALAQILQQQEIERLARKAGKYSKSTGSSDSGSGGSFNLGWGPVGVTIPF